MTGATFAWQAQHFDSLGTCLRAFGRRGGPAAFAWQAQHFVHLALLLRRQGAALYASSATFAWQAQHFDSLGLACARLVAAGDRLLLRGRHSILCIKRYTFSVAGAALSVIWSATFAWQAQHFDSLGVACARLVAAGDRPLVRGRCSTLCI